MKRIKLTENQLAWLTSRGGRDINDVFLYNDKPHIYMSDGTKYVEFEIPEDRYIVAKKVKTWINRYYTNVRYSWETE